MKSNLMLVFQRHPNEASIIGRLLAGYGELEYEFALCLAELVSPREPGPPIRAFFRLRGEAAKLDVADAFMGPLCDRAGLGDEYREAHFAIQYCRTIRNQYAHSHWDESPDGLLLSNLTQEAAQERDHFPDFPRLVDFALLTEQEKYFNYTSQCIGYVRLTLRFRGGEIVIQPSPIAKQQPPPRYHSR